jgi:hypothetical protein
VAADPPPEAEKLADQWMGALRYYQKHPHDKETHKPKWLVALDRLHRLDKRSWDEIQALVKFVLGDTGDGSRWKGWRNIIRSPQKFRERNRDGELFWDVVERAMRRGNGGNKRHAEDQLNRPGSVNWGSKINREGNRDR